MHNLSAYTKIFKNIKITDACTNLIAEEKGRDGILIKSAIHF
jgi:hypothetical protein